MDHTLRPYTINLINSVIGVSILAMPFCFYKCGYSLGVLVLGFVAYITYLSSCQLLELANFHKKRTYEFLALHVFGSLGKLVVELCMIGMIIGTFVAFYVIIGDLGPEIAKDLFSVEKSPQARAIFLFLLAVFVVFPLSMQKNIESLSNVSAVSILFYSVFLLHIIWLAIQRMFSNEPRKPMIQWNVPGIFQCMPIMSMAFGLQTQLFIVYEALSEPSITLMKTVLKTTLGFVSAVYIGVGFCGYYAFSFHETLPGDILTLYPNSMSVNILKMGFASTVAISFPLLIFPVRASIYSLLFLRKGSSSDISGETSSLMPEHRFKAITAFVVFSTLVCGILVPNVEFVLALTGSVTGSVMFFILPALMYFKTFGADILVDAPKTTTPFSSPTPPHNRLRIHPYIVLCTGVCVLLLGSMVAVEDQHVRLEELKKAAEVKMERLHRAETLKRMADGSKGVKAEEKANEESRKALLSNSQRIPRRSRLKFAADSVGVEERKEPALPERPGRKHFINASIQKKNDSTSHRIVRRHGDRELRNVTDLPTSSLTSSTTSRGISTTPASPTSYKMYSTISPGVLRKPRPPN